MSRELKEVRLYGILAKKFGKYHRFSISTPAEAFSALKANYPEFNKLISETDGLPCRVFIDYEEVSGQKASLPMGKEIIRIVPIVTGHGEAMAAVYIYAYMFAEAYAASALLSAAVNYVLMAAVSSLLAPSPQTPNGAGGGDSTNNRPSYTFNGAVNTAAQGNPIAVGYGRVRVGSQVIYAGLGVEQI